MLEQNFFYLLSATFMSVDLIQIQFWSS